MKTNINHLNIVLNTYISTMVSRFIKLIIHILDKLFYFQEILIQTDKLKYIPRVINKKEILEFGP